MKLPVCELCHREVLELLGEFNLNDSHLLDPDDPDGVPIGWLHARCLLDSPWGAWWAARKKADRAARRLPPIGSAHGIVVHRTGDAREVLALRDDGLDLHIPARSLPLARTVDDGVLIPIEGEYTLHLDGHAGLAREVAQRATTGGCELDWIIDQLGLRDRLLDPRGVDGGAFVAREGLAGSPLTGTMRYAIFVPTAMWAHASGSTRSR